VTTVVSAVITLVGALVVLVWMPGRPAAEEAPVTIGAQPQAESTVPAEVGSAVSAAVEG
jgi:glycine betaine/choline ABC-type transport system substrate-binding protein